jgi:hypothetical protein
MSFQFELKSVVGVDVDATVRTIWNVIKSTPDPARWVYYLRDAIDAYYEGDLGASKKYLETLAREINSMGTDIISVNYGG